MAEHTQIIKLYTELANKPETDFGWDKGIENAKAHNYSKEWFEKLPQEIWKYCAAVGNPFSIGKIKKGFTVVDLGCGAGVDLLISAYLVGDSGKAIGIDITPSMVKKAQMHAKLAGFNNIEVLESSFENIKLEDSSVDVVISNGAINLTSSKESVFSEIHRILKDDGKIYFADMIDIATEDKEESTSCCATKESSCSAEDDWANCVSGTLKKDELIDIIEKAGFKEVECTSLTHYITADTTRGATFKATKIQSSQIRQNHWDNLFNTRDYTKVFWHQESPSISLELINSHAKPNGSILDVGCGASFLVEKLIEQNYTDINLLDTSKISLDIVKTRLEYNSNIPKYICCDITNFKSDKKFDIWHDRAVFHFLLLKDDREKYFKVLKDVLKHDGVTIINTFAVDGDTECAGLSVVQYDDKKMIDELPSGLKLVEYNEFLHKTPKNTFQKYCSFVIKKI